MVSVTNFSKKIYAKMPDLCHNLEALEILKVAWVGNTVNAAADACIAFRNKPPSFLETLKKKMGLEVCVHLTSRNMTTSQNRHKTSLFCDAFDVISSTKRTQRSTYLTAVERSMQEKCFQMQNVHSIAHLAPETFKMGS